MKYLGSSFALVVASFVLGAVLCAVYDLFRVFRLRRKTNAVLLFVSDIVYSAIVSLSLLLLYFNFTYGRVRVYAFAVVLLGFLAWRFTVSRLAINLCLRFMDFAARVLNSSKMRIVRFLKRTLRRIYTDFYCRFTIKSSRNGFRKGSKK